MYSFKKQKLSFTYITICANFKMFELPIKTFKYSKGQSYTLYAKGNLELTQYVPLRPSRYIFKLENQFPVRFLLFWRGNRCHGNILQSSHVRH